MSATLSDSIATDRRREHARRLLSAPAALLADTSPGAASAPVHLIDISLSGAGFLHAGVLPSGRQCVLQVLLPGQSVPASFFVTLVYCQPRPASHFFRCGARIIGAAAGGAMDALVDFLTTPP